MKSLNPSTESCKRSGVIGLGLIPGHGPAVTSIKVSHGHNQYEVAVPFNSNFGRNNPVFASYLKSVISQSLGLNPETCKLLFGGVEKQDGESLQQAGVKDNSEVLIVESVCEQPSPEEVQETPVASKGEDAVAEARKEINNLEQQVSALQAVIDSGKKVDEKEIMYLTEMLMRQLLKLDGIDAEGEGKVQRKAEVRRVQNIVETLDALKTRNSNSSNHTDKNASVSTEWRAFDDSPSSAPPVVPSTSSFPTPSPSPAPPVVPSSFPSPNPNPNPNPSSALPVMQPYPPSPMPVPSMYPAPYLTPSNMPSQNYPAVPSPNYPAMPYPYAVPSPTQYYTHPAMPSTTPYPYQYYDPSQMTYLPPSNVPSPFAPAPYHVPPHESPSNPFSMPSSTKVTENWEHFS